MKRIILFIILLAIWGCKSDKGSEVKANSNSAKVENKGIFPVKDMIIENSDEEGWGADIQLPITGISRTDSNISYISNSHFENKEVGFKIIIPTATPESENKLAQILTLQSTGINSNNLVAALAKLYKVKVDSALSFVAYKKIAFIDLNEFAKAKFGQYPGDKSSSKEMKVFFEAKNPDDNAELYVNINENEHWIEIKEKDEGYREQVIRGLTRN